MRTDAQEPNRASLVGGGESDDQLALSTHHRLSSIQRYIQLFVRVVALHEQEQQRSSQIAFLLQWSVRLVAEHLLVYQQLSEPAQRQRLSEQLQRLQAREAKKGGL